MKTFKQFLAEGKDEAKAIRELLKKVLKLSNRDVSVTSRYGGTSSSVSVAIKTMKALKLKTKIENIGSSKEQYSRDSFGDILSGGNTFIFTDIDYKLDKELKDLVQKEYMKVSKGGLSIGDYVTIYNEFIVTKHSDLDFNVLKKGTHKQLSSMDEDYIGSTIVRLIGSLDDDSLYAKIK